MSKTTELLAQTSTNRPPALENNTPPVLEKLSTTTSYRLRPVRIRGLDASTHLCADAYPSHIEIDAERATITVGSPVFGPDYVHVTVSGQLTGRRPVLENWRSLEWANRGRDTFRVGELAEAPDFLMATLHAAFPGPETSRQEAAQLRREEASRG